MATRCRQFSLGRVFLLCIPALLAAKVWADETPLVLEGTVVSGAPVADAYVALEESGAGTLTDPEGRYRLEAVTAGVYTLTVSAAGYLPYVTQVELPREDPLIVVLEAEVVDLGTVEVTAPGVDVPLPSGSAAVVDHETVVKAPTAGDPFNVVDMEEGIVFQDVLTDSAYAPTGVGLTLGDSRRAYSVYGADSDFNTYYYDYIRIPSSRHLGSGAPIVPTELVRHVIIVKGTSPVEAGPGIGGLFRAVPDTDFQQDTDFRFSPGTDEVSMIWRKRFSPTAGFILSARKSLTEVTMPLLIGGARLLMESATVDVFGTDPLVLASYADLLTRLFVQTSFGRITLDLLGYYDRQHVYLDLLGDYDLSTDSFPYFLTAGLEWTAAPLPALLATMHVYGSYTRRIGEVTQSMDLESYAQAIAESMGVPVEEMLAVMEGIGSGYARLHEEPVLDVAVADGSAAVSFLPGDVLDLTAGLGVRYTQLGGTYQGFTDMDLTVYGLTLKEKYDIPLVSYQERLLRLHGYAKATGTVAGLKLAGGAGATWYPLHGAVYPSLEAVLTRADAPGPDLSLRAGWSAGAYDEFAYTERKLMEAILATAQSSSFQDLPRSVSVAFKLTTDQRPAGRLQVEPYFSWYYGLSGLALYASYLDPYRTAAASGDLVLQTQMLDPDVGFSTGAGIGYGTASAADKLETSYTLSLTRYRRRGLGGDGWFAPNNDVRHVLRATWDHTFPRGAILSTSLNVYAGKPFTPERVVDPDLGTLEKEEPNGARDLVPRFSLGLRWEREARFFGLRGRSELSCKNVLAFLNPELVGMREQSKSIAGASTRDFQHRSYRLLRTDLLRIFSAMELSAGASFAL